MVTVELIMDEDELIELMMKEFTKRYSFDDITAELMRQYFTLIVNNGSCSLLYGPSRIEDYVMETWDACSVIDQRDPEYDEVVSAWDSGENMLQNGNGEVVAKYKDTYLVQWY